MHADVIAAFSVGIVVGVFVGVFVMGLCRAAGRDFEAIQRMREGEHG